jgi:hypothetical protein
VNQSIVINTYQRDLAKTAVIATMNILEAGRNVSTAQIAASAVLSVEADRCYGGLYYRGKWKRGVAAAAAASSSAAMAIDAGINEEEATDIVQKVLASQGMFMKPVWGVRGHLQNSVVFLKESVKSYKNKKKGSNNPMKKFWKRVKKGVSKVAMTVSNKDKKSDVREVDNYDHRPSSNGDGRTAADFEEREDDEGE